MPEILSTFKQKMVEVVSCLEQYKEKQFDSSFLVTWDNFEPYPNQIEELLQKTKTLVPYTHSKFLCPCDEIKKRLNDMGNVRSEEGTQIFRKS